MNGNQFDINAQGYARVNAIGQLSAENVDFGDRFIGQQRVAVIGLDPIVPELVAAKWIDRTVVQAELLGRIEAQAKLIELVAVGGFGKSLLATWLFHRVKDGFDRSLWLNFRKVPTFNEFARWVLQEIGFLIDDPRVTDEALITELVYRLTEKRCLLVLDQLEAVQESPDLESFGEFLRTWRQRGHKSVVVITTRSSNIVATEANYRLDLAGFTEAEGADFLRRQGIGAEEAGGMETLVQVAEGHPLLLGLAVSWLRQEAGGMIDRAGLDFFAGLFQKYRGDAEAQVEEIFSRLFEDLPERLQRLLLGVVVYRDAFGLEMARGMLADVEVEDLRSLVDEGFLLVRGDRWLLHPLIGRLVGQALVAADQDRESHQKAIDYFMLHLKTEGSSIEDCTEHLEVFHHWCELGKYALANQIMDSCVNLLNLCGYYRLLLAIYERLTKAWSIAQLDDAQEQRNLGWAWQRSGDFYSSLGYYQSAISAYEQAQTLFEELDSLIDKPAPLNGLGSAYYSIGEYPRAINFYHLSLAIQRDIGDRNGEAASLGNLGSAYHSIGEYPMAINFHQQSLATERDIGNRNGEASSMTSLGNIYYSMGGYLKATNFCQQSLAIQSDIGNRNGEADSLVGLGNIYHSMGEYLKATNFYQQSLAIQSDIGNQKGQAASLVGLGSICYSTGEYLKAINFYQQSLAIQRDIGDQNGEADSLGNLSNVYNSIGEYPAAINFGQQCLAIKLDIGDRNGVAASLCNLGNVYHSIREYSKAISFYQQSLAIQHDIGDRNGEALSCHNLNLLYRQRGQFRKSRSYRIQAYRIWQELQLPLAALPFSDFQKRWFQYSGEDWMEKLIQTEQNSAWFFDSIGLIIFIIRWLFSPIRWIRKRLRSKK
jgi:tetratricopeptide (TPR) repeat protein